MTLPEIIKKITPEVSNRLNILKIIDWLLLDNYLNLLEPMTRIELVTY
ncbi:MAG: hypothetical protein H6Q49_1013 [Deltaproteobacteria bacterium]|nr:hypothetical protein [Deltaproteobacteria bacterium]